MEKVRHVSQEPSGKGAPTALIGSELTSQGWGLTPSPELHQGQGPEEGGPSDRALYPRSWLAQSQRDREACSWKGPGNELA